MIDPGDQIHILGWRTLLAVCDVTEREGWSRYRMKGLTTFTDMALEVRPMKPKPLEQAYVVRDCFRKSVVLQMVGTAIPFRWDPGRSAIVVARKHVEAVSEICRFIPGTWRIL